MNTESTVNYLEKQKNEHFKKIDLNKEYEVIKEEDKEEELKEEQKA